MTKNINYGFIQCDELFYLVWDAAHLLIVAIIIIVELHLCFFAASSVSSATRKSICNVRPKNSLPALNMST